MSPTRGVSTAHEEPTSPTRDVATAHEVPMSPTRGVATAHEVPMSPTRGVNTAREATMTPTKGVKTARSPEGKAKAPPVTPPSGQTNVVSPPVYTPQPVSLPITRAYSIPPATVYGDVNRDALLTPKVCFNIGQTAKNASRTPSPYYTTGSIKTMRSMGPRRPRSTSESSSKGSITGSQRLLPHRTNRCTINNTDRSISAERSASRPQSGRRLIATARDSSMSTPKTSLSKGSSIVDRYEQNRTGRISTGNVPIAKTPMSSRRLPSQRDLRKNRAMKSAQTSDNSKKSLDRSSKRGGPWVTARSGSKDRKLSGETLSGKQPLTAAALSKPTPTGGSREGKSGKTLRSRDGSRPSFYGSSRRVRKSNKRNMKKPSKPIDAQTDKEEKPKVVPQEPKQQASPDIRLDTSDIREKNKQTTPSQQTAVNDAKPQIDSGMSLCDKISNLPQGGNVVIHEQNQDGTIKLEVHLSCRMNTSGVLKISGRAPIGLQPKKVTVNGKEIWTES
ncbi:hypothetical protein DICVIV_01436 [Dictyocaulus viviparus]|uniref:Uncharacterized protein n=1 Tax=Dictyocaulus viviparus TaxID=29172 RepID=A0A0D8Y8N7_DICVI|nr:hypothetical protein DICVIV_01436 [Dictyocaulus viviparus]